MAATWIPILVRSEDYAEVAAWVVARECSRNNDTAWSDLQVTGPTVSGGKATDDDAVARRMAEVAANLEQEYSPWEVDLLVQFAKSTGYETVERWKSVMDLACGITGKASRFYSTQDVAALAGMTVDQWRSACRALKRHLKAHYPAETGWPLAAAAGKRFGVYDQLYIYATTETAARWKEARQLAG